MPRSVTGWLSPRRIALTPAAFLAIALVGCGAGQAESPSSQVSSVETATASGGGRTYAGELLGFTIADVDALAADLGLDCTVDHPTGHDTGFFCRTSTSEFETQKWFMISGHLWDDEAYNVTIHATTAPPDEFVSRDAVADVAETLMPWIADLGWYRSGDFDCRAGRQGDREFNNFGPAYSMCASSDADPGGDGRRSSAELDIATEP